MFDAVLHPVLLSPDFIPRYERYYCLHCIDVAQDGSGWALEASCRAHGKQVHGVESGEEGVDYAVGQWLAVLLKRFHQANGELFRRAELVFPSLIGAEDFLFECGHAPPEAA